VRRFPGYRRIVLRDLTKESTTLQAIPMKRHFDRFAVNALACVLVGSWIAGAVVDWSGTAGWLRFLPPLPKLVLTGCFACAMLAAAPLLRRAIAPRTRRLLFDSDKLAAARRGRFAGLVAGIVLGFAMAGGFSHSPVSDDGSVHSSASATSIGATG
jgi:hypothetical protein